MSEIMCVVQQTDGRAHTANLITLFPLNSLNFTTNRKQIMKLFVAVTTVLRPSLHLLVYSAVKSTVNSCLCVMLGAHNVCGT